MPRTARLVIVACAIASIAAVATADDPPQFWSVTGVAANDVLHLRDVPSADSKSLARIPFNAHGLKHLGCRRNHPPMEQWVRMNAAQRRKALTQWCRVEYHGQEGWVAGRFLRKDNGSAR